MNQDPNPTDYPHLEEFIDWLYEHVEELPTTAKELIRIMEAPKRAKAKQEADRKWLEDWKKKHSSPITKGKSL